MIVAPPSQGVVHYSTSLAAGFTIVGHNHKRKPQKIRHRQESNPGPLGETHCSSHWATVAGERDKQSQALNRALYYTVQTPQCFSSDLLLKSYNQKERITFTDDASVVESIGEKIHLFEGETDNIKITNPKDLILAEALLKV